MYKVVTRLEAIVKKINFIENIVKSKGGITFALEDEALINRDIIKQD